MSLLRRLVCTMTDSCETDLDQAPSPSPERLVKVHEVDAAREAMQRSAEPIKRKLTKGTPSFAEALDTVRSRSSFGNVLADRPPEENTQ